jgi:hypothetical protein
MAELYCPPNKLRKRPSDPLASVPKNFFNPRLTGILMIVSSCTPLTFSLDEAPPGMTIDSDNGLISWNPAANQIGTYTVTVRVTDHSPFAVNEQELSDTTTFQLSIGGEGSSLAVTRLTGNLIQLTITGDLGLYELFRSSNLIDWELLDEIRVTASPRHYIDPDPAAEPARFYILRFIPE